MKILHVLNTGKFSGAENVVCQIIGMFRNDPDIEMVYCSPDGEIRKALDERSIAFAPLQTMSVKEVKRVIAEVCPDVIHAHDMKASFIVSRVHGKIPFVCHIHNNAFNARKLTSKAVAFCLAAKKANHIFWVSQSAYEGYCFHRSVKKKSSVLYNIIDIEQLYRKMESDPNEYDYDVIFLGRISPEKNPHRFLEVFRLLARKKKDIKIAVVGNGKMLDEIVDEARQYDLLNNVSFLGFQSNPLKMLYDSKVMIMTSLWEGTPMCALEAMALGTPIVSTPVDGLMDLIKNDENGFFTDDNEVMANKIIEYISDPVLLKRLSASQIEKAEIWNDIAAYRKKILESYTVL